MKESRRFRRPARVCAAWLAVFAAAFAALWAARRPAPRFTVPASATARPLAFTPDGALLTVSWLSSSRTLLRVWDADGRRAESVTLPFSPMSHAAVSPDGRFVALLDLGTDASAQAIGPAAVAVHDRQTGRLGGSVATGNLDLETLRTAFSDDGRTLFVTAAPLGTTLGWQTVAWDCRENREVGRFADLTGSFHLGGSGRWLAAGRWRNVPTVTADVSLLDAASLEERRRLAIGMSELATAHASADGRVTVVGRNALGPVVQVWDGSTGNKVSEWVPPAKFNGTAIDSDGTAVVAVEATPSGQGLVTRDAADGRELGRVPWAAGRDHWLRSNAGGFALVAGNDPPSSWLPGWAADRLPSRFVARLTAPSGVLRVIDRAAGREVLSVPAYSSVYTTPALTPDGSRLAVSVVDGSVQVWDLPPAPPSPARVAANAAAVTAVLMVTAALARRRTRRSPLVPPP